MILQGARHIAILALHILLFISYVYALELDIESRGKKLDSRDIHSMIGIAGLLIDFLVSHG